MERLDEGGKRIDVRFQPLDPPGGEQGAQRKLGKTKVVVRSAMDRVAETGAQDTAAAGAQHTVDFLDGLSGSGQMFEQFGADHGVERFFPEGHVKRIPQNVDVLLGGQVDPNRPRMMPGVTTRAAPQIQNPAVKLDRVEESVQGETGWTPTAHDRLPQISLRRFSSPPHEAPLPGRNLLVSRNADDT